MMVSVTALWLPILLSAVLVFVASSILHMVLTYHRTDYGKLPSEEKVLTALREAGISPGAYAFPFASSPKEMGTPEMMEKYKQGPAGLLIALRPGPPALGKNLAAWFLFCVFVGVFVAYIGGLALDKTAGYLTVFRISGAVAVLGYTAGDLVDTIWKGQPWSTTLKGVIDGLIYGLLTAGVFGWLWPSA
jgi:hypothetical protein